MSFLACVGCALGAPLLVAAGVGRGAEPGPGWSAARPSVLLQALTLGGWIFFLGLAGLAWGFPGPDPTTVWHGAIATFLFFACLSLLSFALGRRQTVLWNQRSVEGGDLWGRRSQHDWSELRDVEWVEWANCLRLCFAGSRQIWISPWASDFSPFCVQLLRSCPAARARLRQHLPPTDR